MSRIEDAVCSKIQSRAEVGYKKYNKTMERNDLSFKDWLVHAQEEAMDFIVYLQKLIELHDRDNLQVTEQDQGSRNPSDKLQG